jgi:ketosteroid isomerase-like protein
MADNVEVLKKAYKAFSEGDVEGALEPFADDAVWQGSDSTELPGGGEHSGKEAIGEVLKEVAGAYDELTLSFDEFYSNEDTVVVLLSNKVEKGDESAEIPTVHIVRFKDGDVTRFQVLTDTLQAAQVLGLIGGKPPSDEESDDDDDEKDSGDDDGKDSKDDDSDDDSKDDDSDDDSKDDDSDDDSKDDDSKDDDSKDDDSKDDDSEDDDSEDDDSDDDSKDDDSKDDDSDDDSKDDDSDDDSKDDSEDDSKD